MLTADAAKDLQKKALKEREEWSSSKKFDRMVRRINKLIAKRAKKGKNFVMIKTFGVKKWQRVVIANHFKELGYSFSSSYRKKVVEVRW